MITEKKEKKSENESNVSKSNGIDQKINKTNNQQ